MPGQGKKRGKSKGKTKVWKKKRQKHKGSGEVSSPSTVYKEGQKTQSQLRSAYAQEGLIEQYRATLLSYHAIPCLTDSLYRQKNEAARRAGLVKGNDCLIRRRGKILRMATLRRQKGSRAWDVVRFHGPFAVAANAYVEHAPARSCSESPWRTGSGALRQLL